MIFLQTPVSSADPLLNLIQWGVLGIVLILLLTGWLWAKPAVDDLRKRHAEERELWENRILPAIDANTRELRELKDELRNMRRA